VLCCPYAPADLKTLQPQQDDTKELRNHVIIAGYGRAGQIIAQMLSELLIPFVALDVRSDRCDTLSAQSLASSHVSMPKEAPV
jgi:voltage-gated potassium channel Kch